MAQKFSKSFYNSKEWKQCRKRYIQLMPIEKRGLCERCYAKGKIVDGEELHHKIRLTPDNINDREITLSHKNLIFLCSECHKEVHGFKKEERYKYDCDGNLVPL